MKLWNCHQCGYEGKTPDHVQIHFHSCTPPQRPRRWTPPEQEGTTLEEVWARVFADAYGGYRPPTPEEARAETGEEGRRKRGTGYRPRNRGEREV